MCLSKRNSYKLRKLPQTLLLDDSVLFPAHPSPTQSLRQTCTHSSGWSWNVTSWWNLPWSSSCNSRQWLRMFLLSPRALLPDCYRAHLIVWMAVAWLPIKLGVLTTSFIFMWLETHKVPLSPYPESPVRGNSTAGAPIPQWQKSRHPAFHCELLTPRASQGRLLTTAPPSESVQTLLSLRTKLMFVFGRRCWLYSWASKGISRPAIFLGDC